jgi:hypothetical protein
MTEEEVYKTYSYMFPNRNPDNNGGIIYPIEFGFECDKGLHPLIIKLIEDIAKVDTKKGVIIDQIKEKFGILHFYWSYQGKCNWYENIINKICNFECRIIDYFYYNELKIFNKKINLCKILKLYKFKLWYVTKTYKQIDKLVKEAEKKSVTICETCGKKGKVRNVNYWYKCVCSKHYKEWKNK